MMFILEICSPDYFRKFRPQNVKVLNDMPHNLCMCIYHANYIEAVKSLSKLSPNIPDYANGFVQHFLCENSKDDCWFGKCDQCTGISVEKLAAFVKFYGKLPMNTSTSWYTWIKSQTSNRIEKKETSGTLDKLIVHIASISPQFLRHSIVKRQQSETFNSFDRPRAKNIEFDREALIQIDFAENFVCEYQDEVQSAHWNQRQLSLFTTALYHNEEFRPKVFVSNNLNHTKETIIPYLYKLLTDLPSSVKILKIWSDGPSSQFKNRYIAAVIPIFEKEFDLKIYWNYFATSHGKGCIDGIGATVKMVVRKHIRARDSIVNSASDFVSAFHRTESTIAIEEVTEKDFEEINTMFGAAEVFKQAKVVRDIASAHQIQAINQKIVTFKTSNQGYK